MNEAHALSSVPFIGREVEAPEVVSVLEGKDTIALSDDLTTDETQVVPKRESFAVRIKRMSVAERVKLALRGNKEARQILARDPVKLIQTCVLKNARFTTEEALAMAKNRSLAAELLRMIAADREWVRHYPVRLALVQNPKTPLQVTLRLLSGIHDRDMRGMAKSRNVPSVVQAQVRRMLARKGLG